MGARMNKKLYETELKRLQAQLVEMQAWVQSTGARVVVIFEGRDGAGKGSAIKRVTEYLNTPALHESSPCPHPASGTRRGGTSSGMSHTCRRPGRS